MILAKTNPFFLLVNVSYSIELDQDTLNKNFSVRSSSHIDDLNGSETVE